MKLLPDWRRSWRWFSVQAMALALAVQGAWAALTPDQVAALPDWTVQAVTGVVLVLGIIGRLVAQDD